MWDRGYVCLLNFQYNKVPSIVENLWRMYIAFGKGGVGYFGGVFVGGDVSVLSLSTSQQF